MLSRNLSIAKAEGASDSPVTVVPNSQVLSDGPLLVIADINVLLPYEEDSLIDHVLYGQQTEPDRCAAIFLLADLNSKSPLRVKDRLFTITTRSVSLQCSENTS